MFPRFWILANLIPEGIVLCKRFLLILLAIVTLACTGCFGGSTELSIDESGEVHSKFTVVGMDFMREEIERQKQKLLKGHPNATVTPAKDGNMSGFTVAVDYENMDRFAGDGWEFYASRPGLCKGIQKKSRWFFDAYSFDLFVEGNENIKPDKDVAAMAEAFLSQIRFDFTLNIPYEAESQNADTVFNGNKTLSWNISSALTKGESKRINATFKIWNKLHIGLTIAATVMLLAVAILFAVQASAAEGEDKRTKMGLAMGAGAVFLFLALASAYILLSPVSFTNSDIISGTIQSETKPNTTQNSPQVPEPKPKPSQPSAQPNRPNTQQPSSQQNRPNTQQPSRPNNTPAAPKPQERETPAQVLQAFHRNITNKNYRKAYNCLSKDFQNSMSYEGWASGFQTTVSSTASDVNIISQTDSQAVLTYTLKAVDNPGGTKYFRGTAVLIKENDVWKIDEVTNKTM